MPWRRAFTTWTLDFDDGQAVPGRDAYQQRDALAKALVDALGGDEDLAQALADDDRFVDAVRATFESPKSLGSQPAVLDAGACDEYAFVSGATRRRATTADVDWEAMHPSASANTLTVAAGTTVTFTWTDNHDVWEFASEADYNSCNFAGAVEKASTSVQTVDVAAPTAATTKYYGCKVSDHCTDGQKIAISWTDADGCLSDEEYQCDSNCDGSCDQCNESCDDNCNSGCDEDSEGNYCDEHYDYDCRYGCNEDCTTGCDDNCNDNCDGSCDGSCSCKDADAASTRAAASGAVLLALAATLL